MDALIDFLNWAWARHHNPLSWYIRPLFILPFCYFACRRSVRGMAWTIVAVTSSMFWFPAPATPDATAARFLEVEREWIAGPLTLAQVVLTALIPVWFIALAAAIRRRLWMAAALVISAGTALKVGWSFYMGGASAWIIVPPIAFGNAVVAGVLTGGRGISPWVSQQHNCLDRNDNWGALQLIAVPLVLFVNRLRRDRLSEAIAS